MQHSATLINMSRMSRSSRQVRSPARMGVCKCKLTTLPVKAGRALFRSSASSRAGSLTDSRTGAIKALHAAYLAAGCPRNPGGVGWNPFLPDLLRVFRTGNGWMFQVVEFKWRATAPARVSP